LPGVEHGTRSIAASGGRKAAHSAIASSAPSTSPEGDETATSASSSRWAREAISAAPSATNWSIGTNPLEARAATGSIEFSRPRELENLPRGKVLRRPAFAHVPLGQDAQGVVDRGRDAVEPADQRDLPV